MRSQTSHAGFYIVASDLNVQSRNEKSWGQDYVKLLDILKKDQMYMYIKHELKHNMIRTVTLN